jgi:hypothetical protein
LVPPEGQAVRSKAFSRSPSLVRDNSAPLVLEVLAHLKGPRLRTGQASSTRRRPLVNTNAGAPNAANHSLYRSPVTSKPDGLRQSQQFDGLDLQDRR